MSELFIMKKKRLLTSIKLLWAILLCILAINIFVNLSFVYTVMPVAILLSTIVTFLLYKNKLAYLEYIIISSLYFTMVVAIALTPLLITFLFIWFVLVFSTIYQNLKVTIFSSIVSFVLTIYFFFAYRVEIFYAFSTIDVFYLLLFNTFLTTIFLLNQHIKSKWEEQILSQRKALRESETRYRTLIEQSPDPIVVYRKNMIIYANVAAINRVGLHSMEGLVGKNIFDFLHPDSHKDVKRLINNLQIKKEINFIEAKFRGKNGEFFYGEMSTAEIVFNNAKALQVVVRDITDRKQSEQQLQLMNEKLKELSNTDSLTGIANRRSFEQQIQVEWKRAIRNFKPVSILMIDIDYFKQYNDFYGHQAGDETLIKVASALKSSLKRPTDILGRYGGEEFILALPETDNYGAFQVAKRVQEEISKLNISHVASNISNILTVSIGIATISPTMHCSVGNLIQLADDALYRSKKKGRNKIYVSMKCLS